MPINRARVSEKRERGKSRMRDRISGIFRWFAITFIILADIVNKALVQIQNLICGKSGVINAKTQTEKIFLIGRLSNAAKHSRGESDTTAGQIITTEAKRKCTSKLKEEEEKKYKHEIQNQQNQKQQQPQQQQKSIVDNIEYFKTFALWMRGWFHWECSTELQTLTSLQTPTTTDDP